MAGFPDLIVIAPGGRFLLLEVKTRIGRLSGSQILKIQALENMGANVAIVRNLDDAKKALAKIQIYC
jgi:hypothetical protein